MKSPTTDTFDKIFIGGDLSGIQKYLYNITSTDAAVSLKGRSYFLRHYMEDTCEKLVRHLYACSVIEPEVIYCSGGKFYVIAPYTVEGEKMLRNFYTETQSDLWRKQHGQLSINFGHVPFRENSDGTVNLEGLSGEKPSILWQRVTAQFSRQKNQKFLAELHQHYADFFEVTPVSEKHHVCALTGIESKECVREENGKHILPSVAEQIAKGKELRKEEGFKTFEEYAAGTYLGILRMDVDGLGSLFVNGFDTICEYKEFSSYLDNYFTSRPEEGHISNLQKIQQREEFKEHLNILYAGGDDIFVVGRWDKVIDFADEVRKDIATYTQGKGLSISGGVAIVSHKFPIAKAAEIAGDAEDKAKIYVFKDKDNKEHPKNAFCMFGQAVSWEHEFNEVKRYKEEFVEIIGKGLPKGILHKIMCYAKMAEDCKYKEKKGENPDYSYIWHSSYYLTRMAERLKGNDTAIAFCRKLRDKDLYGPNAQYRLIALAARWAELTLRFTKP